MKRPLLITALVLTLLFALPMSVCATDAPDGSGTRNTMQVEYRYAEGEEVVIPPDIDRMGFTYHLVSQSPPVLESTLPEVRTYTFRVEGYLTPAQVASIAGIDGVKLIPHYIVKERQADKEVQLPMRTNDVDNVPMTMTLQVTSGTDPSGYEMKTLDRAGIVFELADPPYDKYGLPAGYIANVVYRGVETYSVIGYYTGEATFTTSETESETPIYVIVADYATDEFTPQIDEEEEEVIAPIAEPEAPTPEEEPLGIIENQTGNPFVDIANGNVPLGGGGVIGVWSFLSLIFSVAGIAIACIFAIGAFIRRRLASNLENMGVYNEEWLSAVKRRGLLLRTLTIVIGIITLITWLFLDDFTLGMVWINSNTLIIGILFAVTVALCIFTNIRDNKIYENAIGEKESLKEFIPA